MVTKVLPSPISTSVCKRSKHFDTIKNWGSCSEEGLKNRVQRTSGDSLNKTSLAEEKLLPKDPQCDWYNMSRIPATETEMEIFYRYFAPDPSTNKNSGTQQAVELEKRTEKTDYLPQQKGREAKEPSMRPDYVYPSSFYE
jgi:hypothetical protein